MMSERAAPPPRIHCLWIEGRLSFLELLCLASMRDAGHAVTLWSYGAVPNAPDFVDRRDAAEVLAGDMVRRHARTGSPALHSDLFRYRLLAAHPGALWADTDAYVLRPLQVRDGHLHGWESAHRINGGVLALPADSATLRALLDFTADPAPIPPWFAPQEQAALRAAAAAGRPAPPEALSWGVWGPQALTHFLQATGEARFSLPCEALYPVPFKERAVLLKVARKAEAWIGPETMSVHLYGRRMRARLREREGGRPKKSSWLARAMAKHGIEAGAAPLAA